jgi:hypothetical protein
MLEKQDSMLSFQKDTILEISDLKHEVVHTLESRYITIENQLHEIRIALKNAGIMS